MAATDTSTSKLAMSFAVPVVMALAGYVAAELNQGREVDKQVGVLVNQISGLAKSVDGLSESSRQMRAAAQSIAINQAGAEKDIQALRSRQEDLIDRVRDLERR